MHFLQEQEAKLRALVSQCEAREQQLVKVELEFLSRRESSERDIAQRIADGQRTIRHAQEEYRHQLDLEKSRRDELQKEKDALEKRLAEAHRRSESAEKALEQYKVSYKHIYFNCS